MALCSGAILFLNWSSDTSIYRYIGTFKIGRTIKEIYYINTINYYNTILYIPHRIPHDLWG